MNGYRTVIWAMVVVVAAGVATPAMAQEASGGKQRAERAKQAFEKGMEHYVKEEYAKAIVQFKRANDLYPSAILWYNIALARMNQGKDTKALYAAEKALEFQDDPLETENRAKAQAIVAGSTRVSSARRWIDDHQPKPPESQQRQPSSDGGGLGAVGWSGVAAGGLGVAGLIGVPFVAAKYDRDFQRLKELSTGSSRQTFEDQKQQVEATRRTGRVLLYAGSALAAVGGGLVALDLWGLESNGPDGEHVSTRIGVDGQIWLDVRW